MTSHSVDPRWNLTAEVIAENLAIAHGEVVSVFLTDYQSYALAEAFCAEVYRRGARPHVLLTDERLDRIALTFADLNSLSTPSRLEVESMRASDVHVSFRGMVPPAETQSTEPTDAAQRLAAQRRAKGIVSDLRWKHTRWALVRVPTDAWARFVGLEPTELYESFFAGCLLDWSSLSAQWGELADRLNGTQTVRILSADTDLRLDVTGRRAAVFAGQANWPDGEVATAPLEDQVDGHISFPGRFYFAGAAIEDLRLEFSAGRVSSVTASTGAELARELIRTDSGSDRVGELGIGLNGAMTVWTRDLLMDEKILGTVHIALGRAYPECGGINESSLHWDIVKDLRAGAPSGGGSLYFDDREVMRDGVALW